MAKVTQDALETGKYIVYLNDRVCRAVLSANEEEGWVEVLDIASMAPLNMTESVNLSTEPEPFTALKTKKVHGKVEIKKLD